MNDDLDDFVTEKTPDPDREERGRPRKTYEMKIQDTVVSYDLKAFLKVLNEKMDDFSIQLGDEKMDLQINDIRMRKPESGPIKVDLRVGGKNE